MSNLIDKAEFDRIVLKAQQEEITGFHIYNLLAALRRTKPTRMFWPELLVKNSTTIIFSKVFLEKK